jgi:hypothetical protein
MPVLHRPASRVPARARPALLHLPALRPPVRRVVALFSSILGSESDPDYDRAVDIPPAVNEAAVFIHSVLQEYAFTGRRLWPFVASSLYTAFMAGETGDSRIAVITWDASVHGWGLVLRWWANRTGKVIVGTLPSSADMLHQVQRETLFGVLSLEAAALEVDLSGAVVTLRNDAICALTALRKGSFASVFLQQCAMRACCLERRFGCETLHLHAPGTTLIEEGVDDLSRDTAAAAAGPTSGPHRHPRPSPRLVCHHRRFRFRGQRARTSLLRSVRGAPGRSRGRLRRRRLGLLSLRLPRLRPHSPGDALRFPSPVPHQPLRHEGSSGRRTGPRRHTSLRGRPLVVKAPSRLRLHQHGRLHPPASPTGRFSRLGRRHRPRPLRRRLRAATIAAPSARLPAARAGAASFWGRPPTGSPTDSADRARIHMALSDLASHLRVPPSPAGP